MSDGEQLFKPFVLLLSTMAIFAIVTLMLVQQMQISAENVNAGSAQKDNILNVVGGYEYTLIDPKTGHTVTPANVTSAMVHPKDSKMVFTDANHSNDKKYVQVIRNNSIYDPSSSNIWAKYKDFIAIQRESGAEVFRWHNKWNGAVIPFSQIVSNFDKESNTSIVSFDISSGNDTIFVHFPSNTTTPLWNNNVTVYYGWSLLREQRIDYWQVVRMITTAEIPGLSPRIQFLVTFTWMFSYIFIGFTMIRRIAPW